MLEAIKAQKGKVAAAGAILVAALAVWWYNSAGGVVQPDRREFVDVQTGKVFAFDRKHRSPILPMANPDTGEATLVPIVKRDGKWVITERTLPVVRALGDKNKVVDLKTLEVRAAP